MIKSRKDEIEREKLCDYEKLAQIRQNALYEHQERMKLEKEQREEQEYDEYMEKKKH